MLRRILSVFSVCLLVVVDAKAALGDQLVGASSASGTPTAKLKQSGTAAASYTVTESTDSNKIFIRQYVDSEGLVFAVAWRGPIVPDLESLLGSYAAEFKTSVSNQGKLKGRRRLRVDTGHIVVEGGGRQRDQSGRAYISSSLPVGFNLKDLNSDE